MSGKGFVFKGAKVKVEMAPEALREAAAPVEAMDVKPAKMTTAGKEELQKKGVARKSMFEKAAPVFAPVAKKVAAAAAKPVVAPAPAVPAPVAKPSFQFKKKTAKEPVAESKENEFESESESESKESESNTNSNTSLEGDVKEMADLILEEDKANPYELDGPKVYVPESRRGFSEFIKTTYDSFMLEATESAVATPTGEKYPYQKFVREYMRQESPYRGILVYHGLGSGKTCTAIATSEALYSTANKKIIVMTPFSLRKNFLKEISLCGFRHFRLKNYWVGLPKSDPEALLFAQSVLQIPASHLRTAERIWIPDFRKGDEEANYTSLTGQEQTEIRKQILSILIWDPVKNPEGRIRFINYNGISAKKLQAIACQTPEANFFDNAVVIVDEIHNLVRLMQGTIDPYLIRVKGLKRLMPSEEVTVQRWKPSLCAGGAKTYMRGYLFYRLLLDAKNSKIVGLSGTPIINFPEEMGILMNVLHGYIPTLEGLIEQVGAKVQKDITDIGLKHPFIDFVQASPDPTGGGIRLVLTLLPYGIRKVDASLGVERIPASETVPSLDEIVKMIEAEYQKAGYKFKTPLVPKALPLLPPFGEPFRNNFISIGAENGLALKNKIVLVKRITGLVSYYKGSRADLMPRVKVDEVVRVPMSLHSQRMYIEKREEEITKEKKKKTKQGELGGVWAEVYEVGSGTKTSNYKMGSRQACNFTFPSSVVRPKPLTNLDLKKEAEAGDAGLDILDTAPDSADPRDADEFPELEEADKEDEAEASLTREEDEAAQDYVEGEDEEEGGQTGGQQDVSSDSNSNSSSDSNSNSNSDSNTSSSNSNSSSDSNSSSNSESKEDSPAPAPAQPKKKFDLKARFAQRAQTLAADCKAGQKPGEDYRTAIQRAKECLRTTASDALRLDAKEGLRVHSPKFAEMLKRIADAPGSSLVYSQFLDMEGIGIFRIAMDVNGYAPIEIVKTATGGLIFTKETLDSLKKGPGAQPRYITFSGGEEEDIRRLSLDIFNANFNELPQSLKSVLEEAGYVNNHTGELCRVFCITSAGAEGLSLKCVRAVHLMEPYWNDVRMKQVKGRAIRIGSHLELPEEERDVSIYTYLSCFSPEVQVLRMGDQRIDETVRGADSVDRKSALTLGLPIPQGAAQYVLTTDERLHLIAERKKAITEALESVMKSAAIDCELNIKQNRDSTFKCLPLRGKVGDFLYHPDLDIDIRESASMYSIDEKGPGAAAPAAAAPTQKQDYIFKKLKDVIYRMREVRDPLTKEITGYQMYAKDDSDYKKLLGTAGAKDGMPAPPVKFIKA